MESLLSVVKDWPVIVQGALGSALFSALILIGQRSTAYLSGHVTSASKQRKFNRLKNELVRLNALSSTGNDAGAFFAALLWLRASRPLIKALMWLTLGLIFNSFLSVLGVVGFLGCFYYLFPAFEVVKPIVYEGDVVARIQEIQGELESLSGNA